MVRTFRQIVKDAGTDPDVAQKLGAKVHQPRDWRVRDSIPPEFWARCDALGIASLAELAAAAERRFSPTGNGSSDPEASVVQRAA
jgi:hypothetical protein